MNMHWPKVEENIKTISFYYFKKFELFIVKFRKSRYKEWRSKINKAFMKSNSVKLLHFLHSNKSLADFECFNIHENWFTFIWICSFTTAFIVYGQAHSQREQQDRYMGTSCLLLLPGVQLGSSGKKVGKIKREREFYVYCMAHQFGRSKWYLFVKFWPMMCFCILSITLSNWQRIVDYTQRAMNATTVDLMKMYKE